MIKNRMAKIAGLAVGMSLALGAVATPAGAQTIADLQAQINALLAQLAALQGGSTTTTTACSFTRSLTMGASGADVTCLQQYLQGTGHFTFSGGATGYFGSITKSAVAAWQAANGVSPAVGYFGPVSQARYSAVAGTTGGTTTGGTTTGGITTPGVEGTITVTKNPSPASGVKLYEGDSMKTVLGIKLEAKTSDIKVERIKLDLDETGDTASQDSAFYNKAVQKIYIMDGSTVLASSDLNSSTVVEESNEISITLAGMSFIVPKNTIKVLTVAMDAKSSWDSTYNADSWTVGLATDGVRGVDGAGVNQYGPSAAGVFTNSFTTEDDILDSATLAVSLNSGSPKVNQVICMQGTTEDECDGLEVARFNFRATKDAVTVTDFVLDLVRGGGNNVATATTAYLYDGSTLVGSASVGSGTADDGTIKKATFADIDWVVPADTTRTLSIKLDIDDAGLLADTFTASTDAADTTAENSVGNSVVATGSADGNTVTIRKVGPEVTLVSKSITTNGVPQGNPAAGLTSTSTLTATFNIKVKAVGGDLTIGTIASATPVFAKTGNNNSFELFENGVTSDENTATSTSYSISTTDTTAAIGTNGRILAENAETTIAVTFQIPGRLATGVGVTSGIYAVQFQGLQWFNATTGSVQTTTFMTDELDWRTADVSFP